MYPCRWKSDQETCIRVQSGYKEAAGNYCQTLERYSWLELSVDSVYDGPALNPHTWGGRGLIPCQQYSSTPIPPPPPSSSRGLETMQRACWMWKMILFLRSYFDSHYFLYMFHLALLIMHIFFSSLCFSCRFLHAVSASVWRQWCFC